MQVIDLGLGMLVEGADPQSKARRACSLPLLAGDSVVDFDHAVMDRAQMGQPGLFPLSFKQPLGAEQVKQAAGLTSCWWILAARGAGAKMPTTTSMFHSSPLSLNCNLTIYHRYVKRLLAKARRTKASLPILDIRCQIGQYSFAEAQAVSYSVTREKAPIYCHGLGRSSVPSPATSAASPAA